MTRVRQIQVQQYVANRFGGASRVPTFIQSAMIRHAQTGFSARSEAYILSLCDRFPAVNSAAALEKTSLRFKSRIAEPVVFNADSNEHLRETLLNLGGQVLNSSGIFWGLKCLIEHTPEIEAARALVSRATKVRNEIRPHAYPYRKDEKIVIDDALKESIIRWSGEFKSIDHEIYQLRLKTLSECVAGSDEMILAWCNELGSDSLLPRYHDFKRKLVGTDLTSTEIIELQDEYIELLQATIEAEAKRIWLELTGGKASAKLNGLYLNMFRGLGKDLVLLGLIRKGFSVTLVQEFIRMSLQFFKKYSLDDVTGRFANVESRQHLLLGRFPTANSYLQTAIDNIAGYQQVFGKNAGAFFEKRIHIAGEISQPNPTNAQQRIGTGFYICMQAGQYEDQGGVQIAIYDGPRNLKQPTGPYQQPQKPLARVGLHFGPNNALRIVNIQGSDLSAFGIKEKIEKLAAVFHGASPQTMLLAAVIAWAKYLKFSKVEGISDAAQVAWQDRIAKDIPKGLYDLFFRRFGFTPPDEGSDYWSLDLKTLSIRRKKNNSAHLNTLGEYLRQILVRNSKERPNNWDAQQPQQLAGPVVAFWRTMLPSFADAHFEAAYLPHNKILKPDAPTWRPLRMGKKRDVDIEYALTYDRSRI